MAMALIASSWTLTPKAEAQERRPQAEPLTGIRAMRAVQAMPLE